jgi:hypothetical protein
MLAVSIRQDSAEEVRTRSWFGGVFRAPLVRQATSSPRRPKKQIFGWALAAATLTYFALYAFATMIATPLVAPSAASAKFPIELTSTGDRSVTVLAYGREVGWHVLRVPSAASAGNARVIPAELADAELTLISIGGAGLNMRTIGPYGPVESMSAEARVLTIYQSPRSTGVRSGW